MFTTRNLVKIVFNTFLGFVFILIWLQFVDIKEIFKTISDVNVIMLIPGVFFLLLAQIIRSIRLKIFLSPVKKIALKDLIFLNGCATMLNFLIPIRAGELAKGLYLSSNYDIPVAKALVWIFIDRFIDFVVIFGLAGVFLLLIPTKLPASITFLTITIFIIIIFFSYLIVYQTKSFKKIVNFLKFFLIVNSIKIYFERVSNFFIEAFSIFKRKPVEILALFIISAIGFAADAGIWYFSFLALNSNQDLLKLYLAQLLSALTYIIPAAPGYVGSAEASGLLIFSGVFEIDPNLASAMIVLFHIITAIFVIVFGITSIYFLKINVGKILARIFKRQDNLT